MSASPMEGRGLGDGGAGALHLHHCTLGGVKEGSGVNYVR